MNKWHVMSITKSIFQRLGLLLAFSGCMQYLSAQQTTGSMTPFDYTKAWQEVQALEEKQLPESALAVVNAIYAEAKKEENAAQLVKAVIHQLKLADQREENAMVKNLDKLNAEVQTSVFPARPLLHSMIAQLYWQYYQNNRYQFQQRTAVDGEQGDDILTWTADKLVSETFRHYRHSLEDAGKSKATKIDIYEDVLHNGGPTGRRYRPTLYDFLAHRALDFARINQRSLPSPVDAFVLSDERYFDDAAAFVALNITTDDSLSMEGFAITLLQDLLKMHLNDEDIKVVTDVDIERLSYLYNTHVSPRKRDLYRNAIERLEQRTLSRPVSTRLTYLRASLLLETATEYVPLAGDSHKWDRKSAMELCDEALRRFGDSRGAIECENLQYTIRAKSIQAEVEAQNLPQQPFRGLVTYRNSPSLFYRIVKTTPDEVQAERRKWSRNYNGDQEKAFVEYFIAKKPFKTGSYTLPDDGDFNEHKAEIKFDALPVGEYILLIGTDNAFTRDNNAVGYAFTTVTDIAWIHRNTSEGGTDVFVTSRTTGERLPGVRADVYLKKYNSRTNSYDRVKEASYTTDSKGYFYIPFAKNRDERNFYIDFSRKADRASTTPTDDQRYYGGALYQYPSGDRRTALRTHLFLDRAIYRPGQSIYFKGLVVTTDGLTSTLIPHHQATLQLVDVNGQVRQEVTIRGSDFGTFNGVFQAPSSGLTGNMTIRDAQGTGTVAFSVEEYKRPRFEVAWDTLKGTYKLNDTINATGVAIAYSGAFIDGAKVAYRVVRMTQIPWWRGFYGRPLNRPAVEVTRGVSTTDALGKFAVAFPAIPDLSVAPESDPTFIYTLYADVTDINGETHSNTTTLSVGYNSLLLGLDARDVNLDDAKAVTPQIRITTTNFNGQEEPANGTISIFALKQPDRLFRTRLWEQADRTVFTREAYYKHFPHDQFDDELNKYKWPRAKQVYSGAFDTGKATTVSPGDVDNWAPGEYVAEARTVDRDGREVKQLAYFTVYSPGSKRSSQQAVSYFQPVRLRGEPGEVASFVAGTADRNIHALYEVEQDGKILSSRWIALNQEQMLFEIPLTEAYRGNISLHYTLVRNNRLYAENHVITVPHTNKTLDVTFQSFRDKLQPGQQEQWKLLIKGRTSEKITAEMVATLYDESLDSFRPHNWAATLFGASHSRLSWSSIGNFSKHDFAVYELWNTGTGRVVPPVLYDELNWFGYDFESYYYARRFRASGAPMPAQAEANRLELSKVSKQAEARMAESDGEVVVDLAAASPGEEKTEKPESAPPAKARSNFNETAFFYPALQTNEKGEIIINFTVPEALTRWKMLGFVHTRDLANAFVTNSLVTQKELMVVPNQPRFFREGDKMTFSVKVSSLINTSIDGTAKLEFIDPFTGNTINLLASSSDSQKTFSIAQGQSTTVDWLIEIPEGLQAVTYRVVAQAGNHSDGEEMTIPVVTNRMLVTESLPLPINGRQTREYRLEKLLNNKSKTLRHQQFTLEFTSNPAWYAIQALPYLMEYPYDCVEQTFSKFYANSIAAHVANSNPRIKAVFDTWRNIQPDAPLSKLEKNQELKALLVEETPWVLQATSESERKRNVALLFELNRMADERERAMQKVVQAQLPNGGFSWFPGLPEDRYMTQHIVTGMGHLERMGIRTANDAAVARMLELAIGYLDSRIADDYAKLKSLARQKRIKLEEKHIDNTQLQYLYARSYFSTVRLPEEAREAYTYYVEQARRYWNSESIYLNGLSALALHRLGDTTTPAAIVKSLKERAIHSDEMGMYWKAERGYYWYQAPIETQALMIEVFDEVG